MMMQLLESFISNERPATKDKSVDKSLEKPQEKPKKEEPKVEQPVKKEIQETPYKSEQQTPAQSKPSQAKEENVTEKHLEKASRILEEQKKEEKSGFALGDKGGKQQQPGYQGSQKQNREDDLIDTYGDDFEEEIEEDLPEDNHLLDSNDNANGQKDGAAQSLGGITVSQSMGVDPSVDSLALEDYDYIEPVERLM